MKMSARSGERAMGPLKYVYCAGLGMFGGWFFVVECFVNSLTGTPLDTRRLLVNLAVSAPLGVLWGVVMWFAVISRTR